MNQKYCLIIIAVISVFLSTSLILTLNNISESTTHFEFDVEKYNFEFEYDKQKFTKVLLDIKDDQIIVNPLIVYLNSTNNAVIWSNVSDYPIRINIHDDTEFRVTWPPYFTGDVQPNSHIVLQFNEHRRHDIDLSVTFPKTESVFSDDEEIIQAIFSYDHKVILE